MILTFVLDIFLLLDLKILLYFSVRSEGWGLSCRTTLRWIAVLLCIWKVPGSDLVLRYVFCNQLSAPSPAPLHKCPDSTSN